MLNIEKIGLESGDLITYFIKRLSQMENINIICALNLSLTND